MALFVLPGTGIKLLPEGVLEFVFQRGEIRRAKCM
jgi:hypothetical protein